MDFLRLRVETLIINLEYDLFSGLLLIKIELLQWVRNDWESRVRVIILYEIKLSACLKMWFMSPLLVYQQCP